MGKKLTFQSQEFEETPNDKIEENCTKEQCSETAGGKKR